MSASHQPLESPDEPVRCSVWSQAQQADPIGSAGSYSGYALVDWPLPWPRDAADIPELEKLRLALAGSRVRVQLTVPERPEQRRIALYRLEGSRFRGRESTVDLRSELSEHGTTRPADPAAAGEALAAALTDLLDGGGQDVIGKEILICTHGRRDRCCGSDGTALWQQITAGGGIPGARLARTSHTGGHRFAPTALVLPEGTLWAWLRVEDMEHLAASSGPLGDLVKRYRGCSALPSPAAQAVERAALAEVGRDLLSLQRTAEDLGDGLWRLTAEGPAGTTVWEGRVAKGRTLPVPECGSPISASKKSETEQVLTDFHRVSGPIAARR